MRYDFAVGMELFMELWRSQALSIWTLRRKPKATAIPTAAPEMFVVPEFVAVDLS